MSYTQTDLALLRKKNKKVRMRVRILDEAYQEIAQITGKIKTINFNVDSESDIRRTCNLTLVVPNKEQIQIDFRNTWNRRIVDLYCGVFNDSTGEYVEYHLGMMLMKEGNTNYNATTQEIQLSLVDLMSTLTDIRGYQLGSDHVIPYDSNIKHAMQAVIGDYAVFKRNDIIDFPDVVPYDIVTESGGYPYDILKQMLDLYPQYEMYYSADGTFTVDEIPTKVSDPIDIDYDVIDDMLISTSETADFSLIKNTTEIWGMQLDAIYTAVECVSEGSKYVLDIDSTFETLIPGETYGFTPDVTNQGNQTIQIQETEECPIYTNPSTAVYVPITAGKMVAGIPYVVKYERIVLTPPVEGQESEENGVFILQGELDVHVIYQEINEMPDAQEQQRYKELNGCREVMWKLNTDSPFSAYLDPTTGRIQGEMRQVLQGGEYDAIYTTDLAYQRASYETWLKNRQQDTVEVEMVLIPWMNVNDKVRFHSPEDNNLGTWTVKSIEYDFLRWTMTVVMARFYQFYPFYPYDETEEQS